ncbi:MAG: NUDIX hydrolase [Nitrospinota bacterium]
MKPIGVSESHEIFRNQHLRLYSVAVDFGSFSKRYYVTDYGRRVGVLLLKNESVLLVRQYRFLIDRLSWEIPGGRVEEDETLEQAAFRECREEAGVRCSTLRPVFSYHPGTDVLSNETHIFSCEEFEEVGTRDVREIKTCVWVPFSDCLKMIFSKEIVDVLTITAVVMYAKLHRDEKGGPT